MGERFIASSIKATGEFVGDIITMAKKTCLVQALTDRFEIAKDKFNDLENDITGSITNIAAAAFGLRKVTINEKKPPLTENNLKPKSVYVKGQPHAMQSFNVISSYPELDAVRRPFMEAIAEDEKNYKLGKNAPLLESLKIREAAMIEKFTCEFLKETLVHDLHSLQSSLKNTEQFIPDAPSDVPTELPTYTRK